MAIIYLWHKNSSPQFIKFEASLFVRLQLLTKNYQLRFQIRTSNNFRRQYSGLKCYKLKPVYGNIWYEISVLKYNWGRGGQVIIRHGGAKSIYSTVSTQRRQSPSCNRSKALLISARVNSWVMYSSTLISCRIKLEVQ